MSDKASKFFIDTEFIERGPDFPVTLLSIGIVAEDGREFYAVNADADHSTASEWVKENVLPHLGQRAQLPLAQIRKQILAFIDFPHHNCKPEFWGYYADYDWVVFAQIFGTMMDLPEGWPMFCRDIKQLAVDKGNPKLPEQKSTEHNALADAYWNKLAYEFLESQRTQAPSEQSTRFAEFDDDSHPFRKWWTEHGQYMLSGGGRRESIWAARGWIAREQLICNVEVTGDSMHEASLAGTQAQAAQWISVDTKLPEQSYDVIIARPSKWAKEKYVVTSGFCGISDRRWYSSDGDREEGVTHWQPLPVAPVAALEGKP